ncbi:MAG: hypothetical protein AAF004_07175 [Pseudomonadota bacterium]
MSTFVANHRRRSRLILVIATALLLAVAWVIVVANPTGQFIARNLSVVLVAWCGLVIILARYADDLRWWLGWIGFLVPSCGLLVYLHGAFVYDWSSIASRAVTPALLFQYLPYYAVFAGGIGFSIGWIVGKNVHATRRRYDR